MPVHAAGHATIVVMGGSANIAAVMSNFLYDVIKFFLKIGMRAGDDRMPYNKKWSAFHA